LQYWNFEPKKKDDPEHTAKDDLEPWERVIKPDDEPAERTVKAEGTKVGSHPAKDDETPKPPTKKVPVFFLDEAHKLPALVPDEYAMKMFLDSMLYPPDYTELTIVSLRNKIDCVTSFMQLLIHSTCNGFDK
jgi:hypothetical protein